MKSPCVIRSCQFLRHKTSPLALMAFCLAGASGTVRGAPDVTRMWFTPPVIPVGSTQTVRFEATVTDNPAFVTFEYDGLDRPMYDDGTQGDLQAGDGTWTTLFQASEILSKLTPARVYRPFIGYCKPASGGRYNIFAEVWTPDIGLVDVEVLDPNEQWADYLVNFAATTNELMNFDAPYWANRFYSLHGDDFDFLLFLLIAGKRSNRHYQRVKNDVTGIRVSLLDLTAIYGSAGRLQGCTVFPLSSLFDCGETTFSHEIGHQWINWLDGTPFQSGIPHWPKGDVAVNIMGFSLDGSRVGGRYYYTFTPNGQGGFVVGAGNATNAQVFNSMELYLMGLMSPVEVGMFFVLNDQNANLAVGQTLLPSDITVATVEDVIAACGHRVPASADAQKAFRCATIVLSEQLLDAYAMSFYDWFARRAEAKQRLRYASGFATGTCNPFYLATGQRAVMSSRIEDNDPNRDYSNFESFESGDLSSFPWEQEGDSPWYIVSDQKDSGLQSARAGDIADGQVSTLKITRTCPAGKISFCIKTSCEPGSDKLVFGVDGSVVHEWSGRTEWQQASYPVAAGSHTFEWSYVKDGFGSDDANTAWLDDVLFP